MKKSLIIKINAILLMLIFLMSTVHAANDSSIQNDSASVLFKLKLIQGYEDGSLKLQDRIKRSEFITLAVRMAGLEKNIETGNMTAPFKDITPAHWAYGYIVTAKKFGLASGYPDGTIAPDNFVTFPEAAAVLIRILGYESTMTGVWPDNAVKKAADLGISRNLDLPANKQLTRGEMSIMVRNSLQIEFK